MNRTDAGRVDFARDAQPVRNFIRGTAAQAVKAGGLPGSPLAGPGLAAIKQTLATYGPEFRKAFPAEAADLTRALAGVTASGAKEPLATWPQGYEQAEALTPDSKVSCSAHSTARSAAWAALDESRKQRGRRWLAALFADQRSAAGQLDRAS